MKARRERKEEEEEEKFPLQAQTTEDALSFWERVKSSIASLPYTISPPHYKHLRVSVTNVNIIQRLDDNNLGQQKEQNAKKQQLHLLNPIHVYTSKLCSILRNSTEPPLCFSCTHCGVARLLVSHYFLSPGQDYTGCCSECKDN